MIKYPIVLMMLFSMCCKDEPTKPIEYATFIVETEDVSCTEVYLKVHLGAGYITRNVQIMRDTVEVMNRTMAETDIILIDTNLVPNHTYTYTAQLLKGLEVVCRVAPFQAHTMDTTSHNFVWDTPVYFGSSGSSVLYDVAIINDTLAYAVGEIRINDTVYNLAKWNGQTWELKRITVDFRGNMITPPLDGIFAFSGSQIWIAASGAIIYGDDNIWTLYDVRAITGFDALSFTKCWGVSPSLMYFVGRGGSIVHYNGTPNGAGTWTKIESGTTLDVRDIWGARNTVTGGWEILATAGNPLISPDRKILRITGNTVETISDSGINWALNGIWFSPEKYYWVVGSGIWEKHPKLDVSRWSSKTLTIYTMKAVRGSEINDVFMCGAYGEILHFNGVSWKSHFTQTGISGAYLALCVKNNLVIAVGEKSPQAVILIGRR